jgi:hypothetical protein
MKARFHLQFFWLLPVLAVSLPTMAGCSKAMPLPGPAPQAVHGTVLYQGKPGCAFCVTFYPLQQWAGARFAPSAVTDDSGEFRLRSYKPGDGAPIGQYAVTFTWPIPQHIIDDDTGEPKVVDQLEGRYADPKKSSFRVTVHEGTNELPPFVLQ